MPYAPDYSDDSHQEGDDSQEEDDNDSVYVEARPHVRTRPKTVQLNINVDELKHKFSCVSDRRNVSYRARCDLLSTVVQCGGAELSEIPCGIMTMHKDAEDARIIEEKQDLEDLATDMPEHSQCHVDGKRLQEGSEKWERLPCLLSGFADGRERLLEIPRIENSKGGCHDLADAEWIVIRRPLRGHNDTPFGQPTPSRPIGRRGVGHAQSVFGIFSYYLLVILFLNMVCLTVALT
jgi:hypothetical protein